MPGLSRDLPGSPRQLLGKFGHECLTSNTHQFWPEDETIMIGFCFHANIGPLFLTVFPGRRQALRISSAETWFTAYRR